MLEVTDLQVKYGNVQAVRGVSLSVEEGQIVALLGANGAGKSTTLQTIAGVVKPAGGEIRFGEHSITGQRPERIVGMGLALVPEGRWIFDRMSVEENLRLGATPRRDRAAVGKDLEDVYSRFPALGRYRKSNAGKLSGGESNSWRLLGPCSAGHSCSCWTSLLWASPPLWSGRSSPCS